MSPLVRSLAFAGLLPFLVAPASAASTTAPALHDGETVSPSPLAAGESFLSLSRDLTCSGTVCTTKIKGRKSRQMLISHVSCIATAEDATVLYGVATSEGRTPLAKAVIPVASRASVNDAEVAVVSGQTQIVLGSEDAVEIGIAAGGSALVQASCVLTGTLSKL